MADIVSLAVDNDGPIRLTKGEIAHAICMHLQKTGRLRHEQAYVGFDICRIDGEWRISAAVKPGAQHEERQ